VIDGVRGMDICLIRQIRSEEEYMSIERFGGDREGRRRERSMGG
jgi:hypothetical protein